MTAATEGQAPVRALSSSNGKRFLRSYENQDENDEDEEERGVMTATQVAKWTGRANQWVKEGKTPAGMKEKFGGLSGNISPKDREKLALFLAAWGRANPRGLDRN
ncbi:hypothetical protein V7S43_001574 [Phytophthora oleae]|uniref:RxLR effector protein n=1 Tax=Phytophthora oleae TaxID=2107226 RepID=A0ABD3G5L9_9STRA